MTNPIIVPMPSVGEQLQPGIAQFIQALQHRQQLGLQRQQLELERQRTQASIEESAAQTAESRGRLKKLLAELDERDLENRAQDYATESYISVVSMPGGTSAENLSKMRERIVRQGDPKVRSRALLLFDEMHNTAIKAAADEALARTRTVEANVAEATEGATIEAQNLQDDVARAQLEEAEQGAEFNRLRAALAELEIERDPQRVNIAKSIWEGGAVTWQQAREAAGVGPGGIPDDATYTPMDAATATAERAEARNYAMQMIPANAVINALVRDHFVATKQMVVNGKVYQPGDLLDPTVADMAMKSDAASVRKQPGARVTITGDLQKAAKSNSLRIALNKMQDPVQQQILQAGLQYTMAYRFFMSGAQSSDTEYLNMLKLTVELAGDSDSVIRQKRLMRQMQINAVSQVAGGMDPVAVLRDTEALARAEGMGEPFLRALTYERQLAERAQAKAVAGVADTLHVSDAEGVGGLADWGIGLLDSLTTTTAFRRSGTGGRF